MATRIAQLPGMRELWERTRGDPRVRVAVLDGPVDRKHSCFRGAKLTQLPGPMPVTPGGGKMAAHGTHVASLIFGQPDSAVLGVAPGSHGLLACIYADAEGSRTSQRELAAAISEAREAGALVINISGGELSNTGQADPLLVQAVGKCRDQGVLLVAAAGNDACRCLHVPAALSSVLAVGAMDELGVPLGISNWGDVYQSQGILAPGHNMLGAAPGEGTAAKTGTSYATPIVSGVAALLLAVQLALGREPDPLAVGEALLSSATPCDEKLYGDCQKFLAGRLNVPGALALITNPRRKTMSNELASMTTSEMSPSEAAAPGPSASEATAAGPSAAVEAGVAASDQESPQAAPPAAAACVMTSRSSPSDRGVTYRAMRGPSRGGPGAALRASGIAASDCGCKKGNGKSYVFAIGTLNYDFGSEARRDSFKERMPEVTPDGIPYLEPYPPLDNEPPPGTHFPPNPYDARQMVNYLGGYPAPPLPFPTVGGFPQLKHFPDGKPITPPPYPESPAPFPPPLHEPPGDYRGFPAQLTEATELIWTLNVDLTPVYAIRPGGNFSTEVYQRLVEFLVCQVRPPTDPYYVSRVSIPGLLTGETMQLFSGQVVPVMVPNIRAMYAWSERQLVLTVLQVLGFDLNSTDPQAQSDAQTAAHGIRNFLNRVYYELRNLGQSSQERALNYAGTNAFQAASIIVELATKYPPPPGTNVPLFELQSISVERSPFCRIDSDCWDVFLKFFYPDNVLKARDIYSYTIDVSDPYPVSIGTLRTWSSPD